MPPKQQLKRNLSDRFIFFLPGMVWLPRLRTHFSSQRGFVVAEPMKSWKVKTSNKSPNHIICPSISLCGTKKLKNKSVWCSCIIKMVKNYANVGGKSESEENRSARSLIENWKVTAHFLSHESIPNRRGDRREWVKVKKSSSFRVNLEFSGRRGV